MYVIISGTGRLGGAVARALLADGKPVRVLARTPAKAEELRRLGAEVQQADMTDPESLARGCRGAEKLLATAHAINGTGANSSRNVDDLGNHHLIDAAHAEGVKHVVFVSVRGARPDHPIDFVRYKYEAEEYLRRSALTHTILRAPPFMETWADMIGRPIIESGKTTIFGGGNNPINFISERDVARYALIGLDNPAAANQTLEIGGPENLTLNQVAQLYEQILGVTAKKSHTPVPAMRLMAALMRPLNEGTSRLIRLSILNDTTDMTFDPTAILQRFPMRLTTLEEIARAQVAATSRMRPTGVGAA